MRISAEAQDVREERDRTDGAERKKQVNQQIDRIKSDASIMLSRAEILGLARAIDTQLEMKERMEKQHKLQLEVTRRRFQLNERELEQMEYLRDIESDVTSPRSLRRRKVIRKVHASMRRQQDRLMVCAWGCSKNRLNLVINW